MHEAVVGAARGARADVRASFLARDGARGASGRGRRGRGRGGGGGRGGRGGGRGRRRRRGGRLRGGRGRRGRVGGGGPARRVGKGRRGGVRGGGGRVRGGGPARRVGGGRGRGRWRGVHRGPRGRRPGRGRGLEGGRRGVGGGGGVRWVRGERRRRRPGGEGRIRRRGRRRCVVVRPEKRAARSDGIIRRDEHRGRSVGAGDRGARERDVRRNDRERHEKRRARGRGAETHVRASDLWRARAKIRHHLKVPKHVSSRLPSSRSSGNSNVGLWVGVFQKVAHQIAPPRGTSTFARRCPRTPGRSLRRSRLGRAFCRASGPSWSASARPR